jgi:hypothetical protein
MEVEQCNACRIVIGGREEHYLFEHRGHEICSWCQAHWKYREKLAGREISWDEFTNPGKETLALLRRASI